MGNLLNNKNKMSGYADEKLMRIADGGYSEQNGWNKKICWEAKDVLFECANSQENKNKYRCPDELYAYEMWCPPAFRRIHASRHRAEERDDLIYTKEGLAKYNKERQ